MSSKLTELIESSPSGPPQSVPCGSGVLHRMDSPSMAFSGHFNPSQAYDGFMAVKVFDPACTEFLAKGKDFFEHNNPRYSKFHYGYIGKKPCRQTGRQGSNVRRYLWSKKDGPFGKEFPVSEAPTPDATSGPIYSNSEVPISRINNEGVGNQIRRISNSPPNPDAEGSDELDGEEAEVVPSSTGHPIISS
ncbi:hypothetical protein O181_130630 [Austropuccinia psidii MF-1]|uniref:Uncharacterized protein n=1 Tax=Austropuccinia psidii MF-1 TaxID=1389203 RepID=A0A9Q3QB56_9BASI|nr:hypothetical protein [Austropuccinia psidii MF-1]